MVATLKNNVFWGRNTQIFGTLVPDYTVSHPKNSVLFINTCEVDIYYKTIFI